MFTLLDFKQNLFLLGATAIEDKLQEVSFICIYRLLVPIPTSTLCYRGGLVKIQLVACAGKIARTSDHEPLIGRKPNFLF